MPRTGAAGQSLWACFDTDVQDWRETGRALSDSRSGIHVTWEIIHGNLNDDPLDHPACACTHRWLTEEIPMKQTGFNEARIMGILRQTANGVLAMA